MATQAALDVYGFELNLSPEEAQARRACEAKQQKRAAKWETYFKSGKLPPAAKLKKYCREVTVLALNLVQAASLYKSCDVICRQRVFSCESRKMIVGCMLSGTI